MPCLGQYMHRRRKEARIPAKSTALQVEKGTFTPAVFSTISTFGGMGKEADRLLRLMAERVSFLRRRFRFDLLKTCVIAMRGYKKPTTTAAKIDTLDLDLRTTASSC